MRIKYRRNLLFSLLEEIQENLSHLCVIFNQSDILHTIVYSKLSRESFSMFPAAPFHSLKCCCKRLGTWLICMWSITRQRQ